MLFEIKNESLKKGTEYVIVYQNGTAKAIPINEFNKELTSSLEAINERIKQPLVQIATIVKEKPVEVVNGYKEQMQKFSRVAAFQNLKDDMNYRGVEITDEEFDKIYEFVYAESENECPEAFIPYLEKYSLNEPKTAIQEEVEDE